jgi:AcrR family transcriptional regulator
MAAITKDRRIERTRHSLWQALFALIGERGYDSTSVQHILDRAGVGRATFYAHFRSKEDLLRSGMDAMGDTIAGEWRAGVAHESGHVLGFTAGFLSHMDQHHRQYRGFLRMRRSMVVEHHLRRVLGRMVRQDLTRHCCGSIPPETLEIATAWTVNGFVALVRWWVEKNTGRMPPEELNSIFRKLVLPGLDAVLGKAR